MILYTPLSEQDIFPTEQTSYDSCQTIQVNGRMVQAERLDDGSYRVVQLLSTDPQDYLNSAFTPGEIIK
ncbi:YlzJ-like family protein [Aquibacillus sediminis]|uniref:YlzJ-like family protein n=1 Tax=Aquibacillus sediminis TaxID=2574734 RepID=UPI0011082DF2|nr:YlzJ-like family protein [Aquibacillus sediminis]